MSTLEDSHLSTLHGLAAEAGVPRFRMLRREELLDALRERGITRAPDGGDRTGERPPPRERGGRDRERGGGDRERGGRGRGRGRDEPRRRSGRKREDSEPESDQTEETGEPVKGILDVLPQRYGFLRLSGLESAEGDVYISASQIRRCELRGGDEVSGPARGPRRGERHRALIHVDSVNGAEPGEEPPERPRFDELTPVPATRRIPLSETGEGAEAILARAADLLTPLAYGQRVLVSARPRSGRTTLLRGLAAAVAAAEGPELIVLLVDERPEEATKWRRSFPDAQLAIATAEMSGTEQAHVSDLALARSKRIAESGTDAVLIVDSLSRLGATSGQADAAKALFGSGRETEEEGVGSLTVIATVLDDDDEVANVVATTENALITLDDELAADGVVPALDVAQCRVSAEEDLRDERELESARKLRRLLVDLDPEEAARLLRDRLEGTSSNAELLGQI